MQPNPSTGVGDESGVSARAEISGDALVLDLSAARLPRAQPVSV